MVKYRIREGQVLNHNGRLYRFPEVVDDIPERVAADVAVAGCLELVSQSTPVVEKKKGE